MAYVPLEEITYIEGFDDDTAEEIQNRARDYLDRENEAFDAQRKELGVSDDVAGIEGLTPAMLVRLGENDIKTLEDFAGCVTDDLTGWFETVERKRVRQDGILDGFDISADEAEALIMQSRVKAGWVTQEELDAMKAEAEAAAQAEAEAEASEAAADAAPSEAPEASSNDEAPAV